MVGLAKLQLNADAEAVAWLRRSIEANRNYPSSAFLSRRRPGADSARWMRRGPPHRPDLRSIQALPFAASVLPFSDNPTYLAGRERICEGMRLAGVPEG